TACRDRGSGSPGTRDSTAAQLRTDCSAVSWYRSLARRDHHPDGWRPPERSDGHPATAREAPGRVRCRERVAYRSQGSIPSTAAVRDRKPPHLLDLRRATPRLRL